MKKRFLILFFVVVIGLCGFLFISFYNEAKQEALSDLHQEQSLHARHAARGIEDFFNYWISLLTSLSDSASVVSMDATAKKNFEILYHANRDRIRAITRMSAEGRIAYTFPLNPDAIGRDITRQDHVREILRTRKPVISDVFSAVQGYDTVALHVPVFHNGIFRGSIAVTINFQALSKRYLEDIQIGKTGYAWMASANGIELYCPVPGHTGKSVFENSKDSPSLLAMTREMLKGRQGSAVYTDHGIASDAAADRGPRHSFFTPVAIGNTFWSVVVSASEDEIIASLAHYRNKLVLVIGLLLTVGVLFSYYGLKAFLIIREEERRRRAEEEIRRLNAELELRVLQRTAQLEAVNDELKSFSYSVSHDLRAPLRTIDGFVQALLEDYQNRPLDDVGKNYLERVRAGTRKMGFLIGDMLKLAGVTSAELLHGPVDLSRLVRETAASLQESHPDRVVDLRIQEGIVVGGDRRLLQVAMVNLLDNGWKFTARTRHPRIEFGMEVKDGRKIYFIRDNGVGFDMAYGNKLFAAFGRLHGSDEFPGTGIGLATVKRVIARHGGEVWAEAEAGKGATFYFTLPG